MVTDALELVGIVLRMLAMLPLLVLGVGLLAIAWMFLLLLEALALNPLIVLGGTSGTPVADLSRVCLIFFLEGKCARCGWAIGAHVHQVVTGHLPASRIQLLSQGPTGTTVLIDGWLARRAIAAVEHVRQIGGDPSAVVATLFESMYQLTPGDIGAQRGPN